MEERSDNPLWIMESARGWKVIWCEERPAGGILNANWSLVRDGLTWQEAVNLKRSLEVERCVYDSEV